MQSRKNKFNHCIRVRRGAAVNTVSILTALSLCIVILCVWFTIVGWGSHSSFDYAVNAAVKMDSRLTVRRDATGYCCVQVTDPTDTAPIRVLQLTDIHIGNGLFSRESDKKAIDAVAKLITAVQPDIIAVTGDAVYPVFFQSGTSNNLEGAKVFGTLMEGFGLPWAITLGNHDSESYATHDNLTIASYYASLPHCLNSLESEIENGMADVFGYTNFFVNVLDNTGALDASLVFIDSNMYVDGNILNAYDVIHTDQVGWYATELNRISKAYEGNGVVEGELVNSIAFFHIPVSAYKEAWTAYKVYGDSYPSLVTLHQGDCEEPNDAICSPEHPEEDSFFQMVQALGSTKGCFVGHDHLNYFDLTYLGVRLVYGLSIDYLAYPHIDEKTNQRGGTVITVRGDSLLQNIEDVEQVRLIDVD